MIPTRKLAAMFLCVFVLGVVAGGLLALNFGDMRFSAFLNRTGDPSSFAQRLDKKLATQYQLSPGEQVKIAPLTQQMAKNLYQIRRKFADDVLATLDNSHARIGAQMTPEHRAAYAKDIAAKRQRAASMLLPPPPAGVQP
jgi:hypothetical protein